MNLTSWSLLDVVQRPAGARTQMMDSMPTASQSQKAEACGPHQVVSWPKISAKGRRRRLWKDGAKETWDWAYAEAKMAASFSALTFEIPACTVNKSTPHPKRFLMNSEGFLAGCRKYKVSVTVRFIVLGKCFSEERFGRFLYLLDRWNEKPNYQLAINIIMLFYIFDAVTFLCAFIWDFIPNLVCV